MAVGCLRRYEDERDSIIKELSEKIVEYQNSHSPTKEPEPGHQKYETCKWAFSNWFPINILYAFCLTHPSYVSSPSWAPRFYVATN
jgi:hypothetical protein